MKQSVRSLLLGALCGALSFVLLFLLLPALPFPLPDPLWIGLAAVGCGAVALLLLKGRRPYAPGWVWLGLPVQITLFFLCSDWVCRLWGLSTSGLGWFEYMAQGLGWPLLVTLLQFLLLLLLKKR